MIGSWIYTILHILYILYIIYIYYKYYKRRSLVKTTQQNKSKQKSQNIYSNKSTRIKKLNLTFYPLAISKSLLLSVWGVYVLARVFELCVSNLFINLKLGETVKLRCLLINHLM